MSTIFTYTIPDLPNKNFSLFGSRFSVNLNQAVQNKLSSSGETTREIALRVLKQIKWESDVLSFLTRTFVAIAVSAIVFTAGAALECLAVGTGAFLISPGVAVMSLAMGMLAFSVENIVSGYLPALSQAYREQSEQASILIRQLEASGAATDRIHF